MSHNLRVSEILLTWHERRQNGSAIAADELCRDCPELLDEVMQQIAALESMERFAGGNSTVPNAVSIVSVPPTNSETTFPTPQSKEQSARRAIPGYELGEEIGRGGMGVVYRARDLTLNREIAVKILQDQFEPSSARAIRFVEEAQITGQLQHPGIPAVYQVGRLADGRPFLAMKLIRGDTLADLMKSSAPVNALAVLEAICQAVGYAHAHQVIHRDLKPSNVMVGNFGEVQVMDWGLAKILTSTGPQCEQGDGPDATAAATQIRSQRDTDTPFTQYGEVMGTPAYMAPEQAAGEIDKIDARADVFGVGAILCRLLTGKPPFTGKDVEAVRLNAVRGKTDDAFTRLDACGAELDLVSLCKKCLAFEPADRPANASALATEVANIRAKAEERAKLAELDRARAEVHALEQSKRRKVLLIAGGTLTAVLLAGTVGTTIGLVRAERAKDAEAKRAATEEKAKGEAVAAGKLAEERQAQAELARDQARHRYGMALDAFNQMVFGIQDKLENRPGNYELRKNLLENARAGLQRLLKDAEKESDADRTLVWSHLRMGDIERELGNLLAAQKEFQKGRDLAQRLSDADPKYDVALYDLSISYQRLGNVTLQLGQKADALDCYQKKILVAQRLAAAAPNNEVARSDLGVSFVKVGDVLLELGRAEEANDYFRKSLEVAKRLADADPKSGLAQSNLNASYSRLGNAALKLGQTEDALTYFQKSMEICRRLAAADPTNAEAQSNLSVGFDRLGDVKLQLGQTKEALDFYQKSVQICQRLADADPKNFQAQRRLMVCIWNIAKVYQHRHEFDLAREWFEKSEKLAAGFSKPEFFPEDLPWTRGQIALCRNAEKAIADLEFVFTQKPDQVPGLLDIRVRALLKRKLLAEATASAERFAAWAEKQEKDHDLQRYNAACVFALCAAALDEPARAKLVEKCLALLAKCRDGGYFQDAAKVAHFQQDTDFVGIRSQAKFQEFVKALPPPVKK